MLKTPELVLTSEESKELAAAIAQVASHYDTSLSPKFASWAGLAGVMAGVYGTRAMAVRNRWAEEDEKKKKKAPPANGAPPLDISSFKPADWGLGG